VVDGARSRNTLRAISNQHIIKAGSPVGRGIQMNKGVRIAKGAVVLFLHADTFLPADAFRLVLAATNKSGFVGGAFDLGIRSDKKIFRIYETVVWFRSRLTSVPYGDQAIFLKRSYFKKIGGFKNIPLMEDVELMRRIRHLGGRLYFIPSKVQTSARRWQREGLLYCTLRNWVLLAMYSMGGAPEKLVRFYN
jgi:rSAM/selenodomain-associated transferase 2